MAILDVFVRDESKPAPWAVVNTPLLSVGKHSLTLAEAYTTSVYLFFLWGPFRTVGVASFPLYFVLSHFAHLMDALGSNALSKNVRNFRKAGFGDWTVLAFYQHTYWFAHAIALFTAYLCRDLVVSEEAHRLLHLSLWLKVVVLVTLTEVTFTAGHSLLHTVPSMADLHVFHHCCTSSSFLTNLLFHPLDIHVEFGGGAVVIYGAHFLVFQDPLLLMVTYSVFQIWYMWDHDEALQLPHTHHHAVCGSDYRIYITGKSDPKKNILRGKMNKILNTQLQ